MKLQLIAHYIILEEVIMFKNIDSKYMRELFDREPEAQLIVDTMIENHRTILSLVSHEIRNPLTLLYGNLQLLEQSKPALGSDKLWNSALAEFKYTKELLDQFSEYNNSSKIQLSSCHIKTFIEEICFQFNSSLTSTEASFSSSITTDEVMLIDTLKIKRVLLNLLKNAKEATDKSNCIHLSAHSTQAMLYIEISDNGCGIAPEYMDTLFDAFVTHKVGGTGLGLSICREIIEAHEGSITVVSENNSSTKFTISLPIENL